MKLTASIRRKFRVRNKLKKVSKKDRLRLSISRSSKNISAQIIDDKNQPTVLSASSNQKDMREIKKIKLIFLLLLQKNLQKKHKKKILRIFISIGVYTNIMAA